MSNLCYLSIAAMMGYQIKIRKRVQKSIQPYGIGKSHAQLLYYKHSSENAQARESTIWTSSTATISEDLASCFAHFTSIFLDFKIRLSKKYFRHSEKNGFNYFYKHFLSFIQFFKLFQKKTDLFQSLARNSSMKLIQK